MSYHQVSVRKTPANLRLLLSRFALVGKGGVGALALQRAPTCDQYCRAAEPLAVRAYLDHLGLVGGRFTW